MGSGELWYDHSGRSPVHQGLRGNLNCDGLNVSVPLRAFMPLRPIMNCFALALSLRDILDKTLRTEFSGDF